MTPSVWISKWSMWPEDMDWVVLVNVTTGRYGSCDAGRESLCNRPCRFIHMISVQSVCFCECETWPIWVLSD